jgi:DNA-binding response OmpR family regulator
MLKKVLIVDDEALILDGLSKYLSNKNIEIKTASTGADALQEISAYPYDLCLVDIFLPDIDGIDVMKKIKGASPQTKVVIMTAHDVSSEMKKEIKDNAFHFIGKPFDISQIKTITELVLGRDESIRENNTARDHEPNVRQFLRRQFAQPIDYFAGVFEDGEFKLLTLRGDTVDLSDGGIGIKTDYNLRSGYMIRFSSEVIPQEVGVVKWSMRIKDSYRAGIEFIKRA